MTATPTAPPRRRATAWIALLVTAVLVATGLSVGVAVSASADEPVTGVIEGTVTVPGDPDPALVGEDDVLVTAWRYDYDVDSGLPSAVEEASTVTDAAGAWSFVALPVGEYVFEYSYRGALPNIVSVLSNGSYSIDEALALGSGDYLDTDATATYPTALELGGIVTGTVRAATNAATLVGQPVSLWRAATTLDGTTWLPVANREGGTIGSTAAGGLYSFVGLPSGTYTMQVGGAAGYVAEFWSDQYVGAPEAADSFAVTIGATTTKNFSLATGSKITGTVRSTTGAVLSGIEVTALQGTAWDGFTEAAVTTTASTGKYTFSALLPGNYVLKFASADGASVSYLTEYWNNVTEPSAATTVVLGAGAIRSGIDASLAKAASISGTVSLAGGSGDLTFEVSACRQQYPGVFYLDCEMGTVSYPAPGQYLVTGLAAGTYTVKVDYTGTDNFLDEYLNNAREVGYGAVPDATFFAVASGASVTGKNVELDPGAQISGTVRLNGTPAEGILVEAYNSLADPLNQAAETSALTAADGTYTLVGLDFDTYVVRAGQYSGTASVQWFENSYTQAQASSLSFSGPTTASGTDFDLVDAATISGTILAFDPVTGDDVPAPDRRLTAYRFLDATSSRVERVTDASTDEDGNYALTSLPPGDYAIEITAEWGADDGYLNQYVGGLPGQSTAEVTRITVASGGSVTADDVLVWGGSYRGRVVNALGEGLPDVTVEARDADYVSYGGATTDSDGYFTIVGLRPVAHILQIHTSELDSLGVKYADRSVTAPAAATDAAALALPDLQLELSSTISGVVIGINGKAPAYETEVFAYVTSEDGYSDYVEYTGTNASGGFTLEDLPTGTIHLAFRTYDKKLTDQSPYPFQYLGGSSILELSTPVIITTPGSSTFREARLVTGGALTGIVTNRATGKRLAGISISADQRTGFDEGQALTNASGAYVIPGLDAGGYDVTFNLRSSGFSGTAGLAYGSESRTVYVPDRVTVTSSAGLTPAMKVSGTVRTGTTPLKNVAVTAYAYAGGVVDYDDPYLNDSSTVTDAAGNYSLFLLPGTYVLRFDDPQHRVGSAWLGGAPEVATSTILVVGKAALPGRNITLTATTGSIDATVIDSAGAVPYGFVDVYREDGSPMGQVTGYRAGDPLDRVLPVTNLAPGTYRVVLTRQSRCADINCDTQFPTSTIEFTGVVVGAGATVLNGGDPIVFTDPDVAQPSPTVVPGDEPTLSSTTPQVGDTLSIDAGVWVPVPDRFEYQWFRNGREIAGATNEQYTVTPGDAGKVISASIWGFAEESFGSRVLLDGTDPVLMGDAANPLTSPTVSGLTVAGQILQAKPGTWDLPNLTFRYEWTRSTSTGPDVVVSTAPTYKLAVADVRTPATDATLTLRVTATRVGFAPATITLPIDDVKPAIAMRQTVKSVVSSVAGGYRVTSGTWTPTGSAISYEWRRYAPDGSFVSFAGGSGASSTFTDVDAVSSTDRLVVLVTAVKAGYTTTTITVQARAGAPVTMPTEPILSSVAPQVGYPVTVDTTAAVTSPADATWAYQWLRAGVAIAGATKPGYTPVAADVGKVLSVRVIASVAGYSPSAPLVLTSGTVLAAGAFTAGTATITGVTAVGRVLGVDLGVWSPVPTTVGYKWTRNGVAIAGATKATYTLSSADLDKTIAVTVTGSRLGYLAASTTATAGAVTTLAPQNVTAPSIGVSATVGTKLTAAVGTWDVAPTGYTYQWWQNGVPIPGAVASTYVPIVADLDNEISVTVTAIKTGYPAGVPVSSNSLTIEPGAAIKASAVPVLTVDARASKTARLGKTVIATAGTWPIAALSLTYQWQVNRNDGAGYVDLDGAASKSLVLDASSADDFAAGFTYRVVVSATRAGYLTGPVAISAPLTALP